MQSPRVRIIRWVFFFLSFCRFIPHEGWLAPFPTAKCGKEGKREPCDKITLLATPVPGQAIAKHDPTTHRKKSPRFITNTSIPFEESQLHRLMQAHPRSENTGPYSVSENSLSLRVNTEYPRSRCGDFATMQVLRPW